VEGVKSVIITFLLLSASYAAGNTVVVIRSYLPSSPYPCVTVSRNGKRVSDLPITVYQSGTRLGQSAYWTSSTNKDGIVCPPELPEGKYEIYATSGRRSAELDLEVSKGNNVTGFELALVLPGSLQAAIEAPITIWVQQLRGVVQDASGAVIQKVKIEILRKRSGSEVDENPVVKIGSNDRGQFSSDLENGAYVAIFEYPGFNVTAFSFEVDPKGWKGLELTMQVGDMNRTPPRFADLRASK
jgi:hypothetical protein